jgi:pSer/pThr/pTyr-binding forkhead associated (FHA) protein
MEDLKSSNGTWFKKQRITRKKIEDGDEFVLGTEPVICAFGAPP